MTTSGESYVEMAVAAPLSQSLTYAVPSQLQGRIAVGQSCLVPLGGRRVTGYCLDLGVSAGSRSCRHILDILSPLPLFPPGMVPFFRWLAQYYCFPIGQVIKEALPAGLAVQSGRRIELHAAGAAALAHWQGAASAGKWFADLLRTGSLSPAVTRKIWPRWGRQIRRWQEQKLLVVHEELSKASVGPRQEICVRPLAGRPASCSTKLKKSEQKTLDLLTAMADQQGEQDAVPRRDLTRAYSGARKALAGLAEKQLVELIFRRVMRDPFGLRPPCRPRPKSLTSDQRQVLAAITPAVNAGDFHVFLLHGVTGSGKTEVYLQAAEAALARGRSVLVLVPEIALATQLEGDFYSRFGDAVALLHSGLSKGERYDQWQRIAGGEARVVIGARSAIFAPLADCGLIIIDEEHDGAYKQEDGLRYQARDCAVWRASREQAVVILGSATPSLVSMDHAQSGKYTLLEMTHRVHERPLPTLEIVDLAKERQAAVGEAMPLFSQSLRQAMADTLGRGEQCLIFLNRRGYAGLLLCRQCGQPVQCRHCQVSLTLHRSRQQLVCHYCGFSSPAVTVCARCRSFDLVPVGFGTERLEMELSQLFPDAVVARLDRDTAGSRREYYALLRTVREGKVDILVGTQMIAKGHHFPGVTLVGVVWADAGLGMPDYKAGERTFQLLCQVSGRAGRGERPGRVVVQTNQPMHYSITTAREHDYGGFYEQEMALRRALEFPPFCRLVSLLCSGPQEESVRRVITVLAACCRRLGQRDGSVRVLGPSPAPLTRLRDRYRWHCLLQGKSVAALHRAIAAAQKELSAINGANGVQLHIDVDPENML